MFDEVNYRSGSGPAKRLQVQHGVVPADLAVIVAAPFPDLARQHAVGEGPPPSEPPSWPWTEDSLRMRLEEAHAVVAARPGAAPAR
jgi:hypothetical protein